MDIGIAVDHAGYHLKKPIVTVMGEWGYEVRDFGAYEYVADDDYPDFVMKLAYAVKGGEVGRGVALCGSGVGASIAANKVQGVRAGLIADIYSAHQGVEDDNMNVICFGARVIGCELAIDLIHAFLKADFSGHPRHLRRLSKIRKLEED